MRWSWAVMLGCLANAFLGCSRESMGSAESLRTFGVISLLFAGFTMINAAHVM